MKNNIISKCVSSLSTSPTLNIDEKIKSLSKSQKIYNFTIGEPEFDTPNFIKNACIKAIKDGKTKYVPVAGILQLRENIAEFYKNKNNIKNINKDSIIVSPGAKFSCYNAILAVCNPGDEVIIPTPFWSSYPEMVKLAYAKPIFINCNENNFKISPKMLESVITPKTKLFILNSPNNPSGQVYNKKEIEDLVEVVNKHKIYMLSDEIYEHFIYGNNNYHFSPASVDEKSFNNIITVTGFSKTFSMTGWRLGITIANENIIKAMTKIQSQTLSHATSFAQYGALAIFEKKEKSFYFIKKIKNIYEKRKDFIFKKLNSIKGMSCLETHGSIYLFPNISKFNINSIEFSEKLIDEYQVACVPGSAFGSDNHVRICYTTNDDIIEEGLNKLELFCKKYI